MNKRDRQHRRRRRSTPAADTVDRLLDRARRLYPGGAREGAPAAAYHRDRRALVHALTWPAAWLDEKALAVPPARYEQLLASILDEVQAHGDPARYGRYLPTYLLTCIQRWFLHRGEDLYEELKHVRNALCGIDALLARRPPPSGPAPPPAHTEVLAHAHRVLEAARRGRRQRPKHRQLELF